MSLLKLRNGIGLILIILITTGCNLDRPCNETTLFPVKTGFYKNKDQTLSDTLLSNLTVYAMARSDSLLADQDTLTSISLPLSIFSDTSLFIFRLETVTDTLSFFYDRQMMLISQECGFAMFFSLKEVLTTHHFIDSLALTDKSLDANKKEHLQIIVH